MVVLVVMAVRRAVLFLVWCEKVMLAGVCSTGWRTWRRVCDMVASETWTVGRRAVRQIVYRALRSELWEY